MLTGASATRATAPPPPIAVSTRSLRSSSPTLGMRRRSPRPESRSSRRNGFRASQASAAPATNRALIDPHHGRRVTKHSGKGAVARGAQRQYQHSRHEKHGARQHHPDDHEQRAGRQKNRPPVSPRHPHKPPDHEARGPHSHQRRPSDRQRRRLFSVRFIVRLDSGLRPYTRRAKRGVRPRLPDVLVSRWLGSGLVSGGTESAVR